MRELPERNRPIQPYIVDHDWEERLHAEGEQARLHYTTTSNVEAWTYWVKGLSHSRQAFIKENLTRGLADWQRALALDPASAALNGMLGFLHYVDARFGWWDDRKSAGAKARAYADRAPELDPENPDANTASSLVMLLKRRYDEAAIHARKAARLAPGSADAATYACYVLAFAGYPKEAMAHDERAMTLSPHYPGYYLGILGNAYRLAGRFAQAITTFKAYHDRNPGFALADGDRLSADQPAGAGEGNREATFIHPPGLHD